MNFCDTFEMSYCPILTKSKRTLYHDMNRSFEVFFWCLFLVYINTWLLSTIIIYYFCSQQCLWIAQASLRLLFMYEKYAKANKHISAFLFMFKNAYTHLIHLCGPQWYSLLHFTWLQISQFIHLGRVPTEWSHP